MDKQPIYKILTNDVWQAGAALKSVPPMPIDIKDGYLHFSTATQLNETLKLHFAGQSNLIVLTLAGESLQSHITWEPSRGGQLFPHIYGEIGKEFIVELRKMSVSEAGEIRSEEADS